MASNKTMTNGAKLVIWTTVISIILYLIQYYDWYDFTDIIPMATFNLIVGILAIIGVSMMAYVIYLKKRL